MRISLSAIKHHAKHQIATTKPHGYVVGLVYFLITWLLGILINQVSGIPAQELDNLIMRSYEMIEQLSIPEFYANYFASFVELYRSYSSVWSELIRLAINLVLFAIGIGFTIFSLNVARLREAGIGNLLDGFGVFFRALWLNILIGFFTFLWSLLLIFPGVIASYRYRQALYIMLDNPKMRAIDCIRASKRMMQGHKKELFVLDLSFFGWAMLSIFPFVSVWIAPYMQITYANYYLALLGLQNFSAPGMPGMNPPDNQTPPQQY